MMVCMLFFFSHAGQDNVLSQIEEAQREELIMEISELVQRQLVTETLHGNFRNVLERRMHVCATTMSILPGILSYPIVCLSFYSTVEFPLSNHLLAKY